MRNWKGCVSRMASAIFLIDCNYMIIPSEFLRSPLILENFAENHAVSRNFSLVSVFGPYLTTGICETSVKSSRFNRAWRMLVPKLNRSNNNWEPVMCAANDNRLIGIAA